MNRTEALSLVRELSASCSSFENVQVLFLARDDKLGRFVVRAKWVPSDDEKACLRSIILKRGLEVEEEEGYTVFRVSANPQ